MKIGHIFDSAAINYTFPALTMTKGSITLLTYLLLITSDITFFSKLMTLHYELIYHKCRKDVYKRRIIRFRDHHVNCHYSVGLPILIKYTIFGQIYSNTDYHNCSCIRCTVGQGH